MHDEGAYGCGVGSTARHEPDIETEAPAKIYHDEPVRSVYDSIGLLKRGKRLRSKIGNNKNNNGPKIVIHCDQPFAFLVCSRIFA